MASDRNQPAGTTATPDRERSASQRGHAKHRTDQNTSKRSKESYREGFTTSSMLVI